MQPHTLYQTILREHPLFSALNAGQIGELLENSRLLNLERNEIIFRQSDACEYFYFIISGRVKVYLITQSGQEKVLEIFDDRNTFAEAMMFMSADTYVANAQAVQPTQLLAIPNTTYIQIIRDNPDTAIALLGKLSNKLQKRINEIEILSLKNATHRVIRYLLSQGLRLCGDCNYMSFELPMTKRLVAGHLSIQPETFSRIIHHLSDEGLVRIDGRLFCILDSEKLEQYE